MDKMGENLSNIEIPLNNNFDPETAKYLMKKCSAFIVENFSVGSEFGIDLSIHFTGKNFLGLKMIPPGLHFIYFSLVNRQNNLVSPRNGFFYYFETGECLVTKWDPLEEDIILDQNINEEQIQRLKYHFSNGYLDNHLGAYQFEKYQDWVSLTDYITKSLFQQVNPLCGKIFSVSNLVYKCNSEEMNNVQAKFDRHGLPNMVVSPENEIRFLSKLPKRFLYPPKSSPLEISRHSIDSSFTLNYIIQTYHQNNELGLIGELQFAFITFFLGHVYDSFEFWLNLLRIISCAQSALFTRKEFYLTFIRVLYFQFKQANDSLNIDFVDDKNNSIYQLMRTFFGNLHNSCTQIDKELFRRGKMFQNSVQKIFGWIFDFENDDEECPDDEKPVIVIT